jgi:hypothetical protein
MRRLIIVLAVCAAAACSTSARSRNNERAKLPVPISAPVPTAPAAIDVTGTWATGSAGEPEAKRIVLRPQCNYGPAVWILEQYGDTVHAWVMPESWAKGVPTPRAVSSTPSVGRVSGVDVVIGTSDARYVLRFDSTSGHLRGTLNGAPFWAVRLEIVRPEGCIAVP